jgi:hypothetical protein
VRLILRAGWDVDLHLDGGHVEVLNGHVDFEEWLGQVKAKRPVHCALHQGDFKEVERSCEICYLCLRTQYL